jgi:hypothetical protein
MGMHYKFVCDKCRMTMKTYAFKAYHASWVVETFQFLMRHTELGHRDRLRLVTDDEAAELDVYWRDCFDRDEDMKAEEEGLKEFYPCDDYEMIKTEYDKFCEDLETDS